MAEKVRILNNNDGEIDHKQLGELTQFLASIPMNYWSAPQMTNFEEIKRKIANMNIDELIEFCGGDTCENVLCAFVRDGDCCGNNCRVSYDCGGCIKKFLQRETGDKITHCPRCGHHVNIQSGETTGYCPICDKEVST